MELNNTIEKATIFDGIRWLPIIIISILMIFLSFLVIATSGLGSVLSGGGGGIITLAVPIIIAICSFLIAIFCKQKRLKNIFAFLLLHFLMFGLLFSISQFYYNDITILGFSFISPLYATNLELNFIENNPIGKGFEKIYNKDFQVGFSDYYLEYSYSNRQSVLFTLRPINFLVENPEYSFDCIKMCEISTGECFECSCSPAYLNILDHYSYMKDEAEPIKVYTNIFKKNAIFNRNNISFDIIIEGTSYLNNRKKITVTNEVPLTIIKNGSLWNTEKTDVQIKLSDDIKKYDKELDKYAIKEFLGFSNYEFEEFRVSTSKTETGGVVPVELFVVVKIDSSPFESDTYYSQLFSDKNKWIFKRKETNEYYAYSFYQTNQFIDGANNEDIPWSNLDNTINWEWRKVHLKKGMSDVNGLIEIDKSSHNIMIKIPILE